MKLFWKIAIALAAILLVGLVVAFGFVYYWVYVLHSNGMLEITNDSITVVKNMILEIGNAKARKAYEIKQLNPHQREVIFFHENGDGDYKCVVNFVDGTVIHETLGYFTSGLDTHDVLHIKDNSLTLESVREEPATK